MPPDSALLYYQLHRPFHHFIPCGVREAVYILDGLLKNESDIQPDVLHADTQGQSESAFALADLLGIELMPRMGHLKNVWVRGATAREKA
jgi:TnpA family transposase